PGRRRSGVEAEPAEGKNKSAQHDHGHAMSWHSVWPPLSVILPDPGAYDYSASKPDKATHPVHDTRTCEVDCPMPQTPVDTALGQPATAPEPVGVETIRQRDPQAI